MDPLLTTREAAALIGRGVDTLKDWRIGRRGGGPTGPRWFKVGRQVRYRRSEVLDWLQEQYDQTGNALNQETEMSARQHVYKIIRIPVEGGQSPNAYVAQITVEIRAYWPPGLGHEQEVVQAIAGVCAEAVAAVITDPPPAQNGWVREP